MKKTALLLLVVFALMMVMSCATYSIPVSATSNAMGSKVGVAEQKQVA